MQEEAMGNLVSVGCRSHQGNKMLVCVSWMIFKRKIHMQQELWVWGTRWLFLLTIKSLHNPDNHSGVIPHLEPGILKCEVKWALGSITTNKASGGDGIPVELFQILKDDAVKVQHSICQQIWKTQQWLQDWKRSVFIPIPKKENVKNVQLPHNYTYLTC